MSITVEIPTPLRRFTGENGEVSVQGRTVGEALQKMVEEHPSLQRHLFTDEGRLRSFVNVFVNNEDIRHLDKEQTKVEDGDHVAIIPSIAGGRP
jgi:MoaD family protein